MKNEKTLLSYKADRRRFLRDAGLTSLGVVLAACAPGAPGGTTLKKGGEFHGAWPYVLPPAGHWNAYAPNGILTTGIFRHLWLTMLGMYRWSDTRRSTSDASTTSRSGNTSTR